MNQVNSISNNINRLNYLHYAFKQPFLNIKLKHTATKEIEAIIKCLKTKNSHEYDEISIKTLKIRTPYILPL
jgi:hypothetical protein